MIIRRCNLDDRDELVTAHGLQRAAYEIEAALIGTRAIPGLRESVEELAASSEEFWGCFQIGAARLCGVIAIEEERDDPARAGPVRISRLAVDPACFRRGVGRKLVRHVLDEFGRGRGRIVRVSTGAANTPGRRLYESEGFRLMGERVAGGVGGEGVRIAEYQWG